MYSPRNSKWDSALFGTCPFQKQCLGNLTHMKRNRITWALVLILTVWTRRVEPERALPKQRTEWENNSVFFYHPCYFQSEKVLLCQPWGHPQQPQCMQPLLVWEQKPSSWYLSTYTTREIYIHCDGRDRFWGLFLPFLPHGNILHLRSWDHISPTALRSLKMGEDIKITYQNPAFNTLPPNHALWQSQALREWNF